MDPSLVGLLLAVLFAGSHIGLASGPVRSRLVGRLGESAFRWLFFGVAAVSFTCLVVWYADHREAGGPGLALGETPLRPLLIALVVAGITLMVAALAGYPGSPYDVQRPARVRPPRGLERITRHPFFAGMAMFAGAHALLATHSSGAVLMLCLAVLSCLGARHQDAKLLRLRGPAFAGYLAQTSAVPFAAIVAGHQRIVWQELPYAALAKGLAVAVALRLVHGEIFAWRGAFVVLAVVGGALVTMVASVLRERRTAVRARTRVA